MAPLGPTPALAQTIRSGERLDHQHRVHSGLECDPLVRASVIATVLLEDRPVITSTSTMPAAA